MLTSKDVINLILGAILGLIVLYQVIVMVMNNC